MELLLVAGALGALAFFGNIRVLAVCVVLAVGAGWYYNQLPRHQQSAWYDSYAQVTSRFNRAWRAFWK